METGNDNLVHEKRSKSEGLKPSGEVKRTALVQAARIGFVLLSWIFVACIAIQVFLAGMAVFVGPANWGKHVSFVHIFEFVPVVMFLLSFLGRLRGGMRWLSLGLYVLIILQYVTANLASKIPMLSALHPVIAMLMFWGAITLGKRSVSSLKAYM